MKTPRELLLGRHQGMEPKLNAARQNALATLTRPSAAQWWRDFVFSLRWHLAGLAAVWLAVLALNVDSGSSAVVMAQNKVPSARVLMASLLKNRRELMEMIAPAPEPASLPPRRTEIQSKVEYV